MAAAEVTVICLRIKLLSTLGIVLKHCKCSVNSTRPLFSWWTDKKQIYPLLCVHECQAYRWSRVRRLQPPRCWLPVFWSAIRKTLIRALLSGGEENWVSKALIPRQRAWKQSKAGACWVYLGPTERPVSWVRVTMWGSAGTPLGRGLEAVPWIGFGLWMEQGIIRDVWIRILWTGVWERKSRGQQDWARRPVRNLLH